MISIIIPTLNEEKYLPRLLKSICRQSFTDYEIIVSDGDSADRTKEIAESYGCKFIRSGVKGISVQRNVGAKLASGDILVFVDADCILPDRNFLSYVVNEFRGRKLDMGTLTFKHDYANAFVVAFDFFYWSLCFITQFFKKIRSHSLSDWKCYGRMNRIAKKRLSGFSENTLYA